MKVFLKAMFVLSLLTCMSGLTWMGCSPQEGNNQEKATSDGGSASEGTGSSRPKLDYASEQMTKGKTFKVIYEVDNASTKIPLNELYNLKIKVLDDKGATAKDVGLKLNACMPDHNHCMLNKIVVEKVKDGEFLVKGMKFHMQGHWEIYADVTSAGKVGEKECIRKCSCTSGDCALFNVWIEF